MANIEKILLEACRASALSCHSSAGLCTSLRNVAGVKVPWISEASRLLRNAEAMCRSAIALLGTKGKSSVDGVVDIADTSSSTKKKRHPSRKKKSVAPMEFTAEFPAPLVAPGFTSVAGVEALKATLDAAIGGISGGAGTAGQSMGSPSSPAFYPIGTRVKTVGLVSSPQLNNKCATVSVDKDANKNDGRIAIILDEDGRGMRVKSQNIDLVSLSTVPGSVTMAAAAAEFS